MGPPFFHFKFYFHLRSTANMYSLTTISVCVLRKGFESSMYFINCSVFFSFTEADWHCYKLEWQQAVSGTVEVIQQRSIVLFQR